LQLLLGPALIVTHGQASAEVARVYTRAQTLCQQGGTPEQRFMVLRGQWILHASRGKFRTALALGEQLMTLSQQAHDAVFLPEAHRTLAPTYFFLGELAAAHAHAKHGLALYDPPQHAALAFHYGQDPGGAARAGASAGNGRGLRDASMDARPPCGGCVRAGVRVLRLAGESQAGVSDT
jgi:hypothetical protein